MNKLFSSHAMTMIINSSLIIPDDEFNYSKYYLDFFKFMSSTGKDEYTRPDYLRGTIDKFGEHFINAYKKTFDTNGYTEETLKKCKSYKFATLDDYFVALRMKFAGNLFEAVVECYFKLRKPRAAGLQTVNDYMPCNGGKDDARGVDGWLVTSISKIPANAKHTAFMPIEKRAPFEKLTTVRMPIVQAAIRKGDPNAVAIANEPVGVLITDNTVGKTELQENFIKEEFPDIVIIDSAELYETIGKTTIGVGDFWENSFAYVKK